MKCKMYILSVQLLFSISLFGQMDSRIQTREKTDTPALNLSNAIDDSNAFAMSSQTVTYTASTEDFMNPDRGFYFPISTKASAFTPLDVNQLISVRTTAFTPWQGNYQVRTSLIFRYYVLDDFVSSAISSSFLANLQTDFNTARQAGVRLIIRFAYTVDPNTSCGSSACPPYGDATEAQVLAHIGQLKPVLQANSDVLAAVQGGFIGVWGEQYYTDHFGDPSSNGEGRITNANWQKRNNVLTDLLDAVPSNRMVQVRYPQLIQRFIYGVNAPVTSNAITESQAHQMTNIARLGLHNDCFLASADDFGTYWDYGSDSNFPSNQIGDLKPYAEATGEYTAIGGETCWDGFSPENDCAGQALTDMASLNFSYLNSDYNNEVNNDWETDGCMDEIKLKLGYRFVLQDATYPTSVAAGTDLDFTMNLENIGFAAPFNERVLQLVLRHTTTNEEVKVTIAGTNIDTRFWKTGTVNLNGTAAVPQDLPIGDYKLLLHISDTSDNNRIANRPEYSIQLANTNIWESTTGYNDLNHTLTINTSTACSATNLVLDGLVTTNETYETDGTIESTENLSGNISVVYDAKESILLKPNFTVDNGTTFHAYIDGCNGTTLRSIAEERNNESDYNAEAAFALDSPFQLSAFPNPFHSYFEINYEVKKEGNFTLTIFDARGKKIAQPFSKTWQSAGNYTLNSETTFSSGLYFVVLEGPAANNTPVRQTIKLFKP